MHSSNFIVICQSLLVFIAVSLTSASRCLCETDTIKTAYCNNKYSFKGTVLEVKDATDRAKRDVTGDDESSYSFDGLGEIELLLPPNALTNDIAVEYRIRIENIFGGVNPALKKQEITMYSTVKDRSCGNPEMKADYGYLFQVDDMMWLDPCERIVRYKDVAKTDRHGLLKHYRFVCKPSQ